jgi:hypothetical protein
MGARLSAIAGAAIAHSVQRVGCELHDHCVRFDVFTAVTMKNGVFWDIKTPVRTSQETHYVSTTELSRLMLCKI